MVAVAVTVVVTFSALLCAVSEFPKVAVGANLASAAPVVFVFALSFSVASPVSPRAATAAMSFAAAPWATVVGQKVCTTGSVKLKHRLHSVEGSCCSIDIGT